MYKALLQRYKQKYLIDIIANIVFVACFSWLSAYAYIYNNIPQKAAAYAEVTIESHTSNKIFYLFQSHSGHPVKGSKFIWPLYGKKLGTDKAETLRVKYNIYKPERHIILGISGIGDAIHISFCVLSACLALSTVLFPWVRTYHLIAIIVLFGGGYLIYETGFYDALFVALLAPFAAYSYVKEKRLQFKGARCYGVVTEVHITDTGKYAGVFIYFSYNVPYSNELYHGSRSYTSGKKIFTGDRVIVCYDPKRPSSHVAL